MELLLSVLLLVCLFSFVLPDAQGDALYALRTSLNASANQLTDWNQNQVNPCTWSNVICDGNNYVKSVTLSSMNFSGTLSPRIGILKTLTTLTLKGSGITGGIPEEFGNLSSLTSLDLENNHLSGEIPLSLGKLQKLQFLTLSQNNLTGAIPQSLSGLPNLINLQLDSNGLSGQIPDHLFQIPQYNFTGNSLNCVENSLHPCVSVNDSGGSRKPRIGIIVGTVGLVILVLLGSLLFFLWRGRRKGYKREVFVDVAGEVDRRITFGQLKRFAWRELQLATESFSEKNILGQGGFGKVYKGVLADNTKVAVKRLTDFESPGGDAAFQREVEMISVAVHKNLLRLIGFCTTPTERLLVYPFMQNLSVAYRLRELKPGEAILDWPTRKRIALGAARGLEYLHEHCNPKIIHRDVKAANVLLDEDFEAVVGDFGLAKLVDVRRTNVTTQVRGTMGHIAPEYLSTGNRKKRNHNVDLMVPLSVFPPLPSNPFHASSHEQEEKRENGFQAPSKPSKTPYHSIKALVVSSAEAARDVLKTHDLDCCSRPSSPGPKRLSYNHLDIAFGPYGDHWKKMRALFISELVSMKRVKSFAYAREAEVDKLINTLSQNSHTPVNLNEKLYGLADGVIGTVAFGKIYGANQFKSEEFHYLLDEAMEMFAGFAAEDFFPSVGRLVDVLTGLKARREKSFRELDAFFESVVEQHLDPTRPKPEHENLVDVLINLLKKQSASFSFTKDHVKAILLVYCFCFLPLN
ncbi:hypothetical protein SLEP1_g28999 [Rubroshorea leprosula]|uniref:non-specific serine/threonine protein kinase n=1 Tax=Rubroshorea leprosula TaxID=152421 RepID=A0AAV5K2K7_9ROSI|nr:hypothetical protein SLEP1_g28999 [Rubroshorea leprosula]